MRVSRSTGYAVLAVCYIAKNQGSGSGVVLSQSVSKEYDIPLEYLLKILQQLVRANVLRSKRGPRGGFSLAKPTNKITMLEIIEAVDGPMSGELNLAEQAKGEKFSGKADAVYEKAVASARNVFNKAKLSALIDPKK
jgi:Rrf2 family protein